MDAAPTPSPVPAPAPPPPDVVGAWPLSAQWATAFLLGVVATLLLVHSFSCLPWGTRPTELHPYRIDLNQAGRAELRQLPGIGEAFAQRIVDHRDQHGFFRSVEDLRQVPGLGPAKLERIRPFLHVTLSPTESAADEPEAPASHLSEAPVKLTRGPVPSTPRRTLGKKEENLKGLIDVNRASVEELQRLPGIGPALSQRMVAERAKRPFQSVDDLRRVSGIGPKILERLRPYVTVGAAPQGVAQAG